jgi:hypothetical protein
MRLMRHAWILPQDYEIMAAWIYQNLDPDRAVFPLTFQEQLLRCRCFRSLGTAQLTGQKLNWN